MRFLAALLACVLSTSAIAADKPATWPFVNGGVDNLRSAKGIALDKVSTLAPTWALQLRGAVKLATPTSDGRSLYVPTGAGRLYRIDRANGTVIWDIDIAEAVGEKGASARTSVAVYDGMLLFGLRNKAMVVALNAETGALLWKTKVDEHPFAQVAQSPIAADGRVFVSMTGVAEEAMPAMRPDYKCCTFRGSAVGLDTKTGKLLWKTYFLPEGFAGASVWSAAGAIDRKRGTVYITTGNAYQAPPDVQACVEKNKGNTTAQEACHPPGVWYDALVAFDVKTGAIKWGFRGSHEDFFTAGCFGFKGAPVRDCGKGPDHDFGAAPMIWSAGGKDFVGAGQKSGMFWALDPDSGKVAWKTSVGPGGPIGGIEFGTAADGQRIYFADSNAKFAGHDPVPNKLVSGREILFGSVGAMDAATGKILWQTPDPAGEGKTVHNGKPCDSLAGTGEDCEGAFIKAPVTVAGGVMFTCSIEPEGHMYAFDAAKGNLLWKFKSGSPCETGAAIMDGVAYWVGGQTLYAFAPGGKGAVVQKPKASATVLAGVYTTAQAERGKGVYQQSCAAGCHMENLGGNGPAQALTGKGFVDRWKGVTLSDLYKKIRDTMPVDKPGSLSADDYLAVTAYLLSSNGYPAGAHALDSAALGAVEIATKN
jgi:polyvinyl alcohol dehydrogenase (cytochrome)